MAIRLETLYRQAKQKYKMKLVAGEGGLGNIVNWVHMVEEERVADFLRGNELIFTTGIGYSDTTWLESFAQGLIRNRASGLVINIGPYVDTVPETVIACCKQENLPLFTIPWQVRLVDVTRDFCRSIIRREQIEISLSGIFRNIIFFPAELPKHQVRLDNYGFDASWGYGVAVFSITATHKDCQEGNMEAVRLYVETIFNRISEKYNIFIQENLMIVVFANFSDEQIVSGINQVVSHYLSKQRSYKLNIGIGQNGNGLQFLRKSYKQAIAVLPVAIKNNCHRVYYNDMGIYKILLSAEEKGLLSEVYNDVLGKLANYDATNNTDYMSTLKCYLENDASVQAVAKATYMHRNTINYKLSKIKEITNCNLASTEDRLKIMLAFKIKDIL